MRFFSKLSALAIVVCISDARPTSSVVFEKVESSPAGWKLDNSAKVDRDGTFITLKIHLVNQGVDKFHKLAMDVGRSHPDEAVEAKLTECTDCNAG